MTQSLSGFAGFAPKARQGGRKRQRPLAAPVGGPGSTLIWPKKRSVIAPVLGLKSVPYSLIRRCEGNVLVTEPGLTPASTSLVKPSNRVRIATSLAPITVNPPVPMIETPIETYAGSVPPTV